MRQRIPEKKPVPTKRARGTGSVKYRPGQGWYFATPKWAGSKEHGAFDFKFQAERALDKWLEDNPRPDPTNALFSRI